MNNTLDLDHRERRPLGWPLDAALVAAFAALTAALVWWPPLLRVDLAVRDWCDAHRPTPAFVVGFGMDFVGQGGPVMTLTLLLAFWLAFRRRSVRPIIPAGLAPILTTVSIVILKRWTSRGSPHFDSVRLFSGSSHVEYPSGHVNNALVYYAALSMLLAPYVPPLAQRLIRWLPGVLVFIGTTYISYHWFTDSVGGYLLGLFLVRLLMRVPWQTMPLPGWLERVRPEPRAGSG